MMWRKVVAVTLLLAFGAVRLPLETRLQAEQVADHFHTAALNLGLRERVGQLGFLAALSGFRSIVASLLWIDAHTAWEKTEWGKMAGIFDTVTTLQPRVTMYWDMAAWHMAWNASIAALEDKKQPSEALRIRSSRQYINLGKDFLERGVQNNPDRYDLYGKLGFLLQQKLDDHCGAAAAYGKAAEFPDAPSYMKRFAAYELAKCPGHEREAYDKLRALYTEGEKERLPALLTTLQEMEEKLNIPPDQRIEKK